MDLRFARVDTYVANFNLVTFALLSAESNTTQRLLTQFRETTENNPRGGGLEILWVGQ